ncbi:Transmembrane ascorbate ferrireductase 1 [Platanthera zijinensis]|uniref:Transmembrane ascorbate ferrireductase 1 n=1 Tax=Platanthera zijinensis TaxID=2320716 RepID=A0AAP0B7I0_9ASPA
MLLCAPLPYALLRMPLHFAFLPGAPPRPRLQVLPRTLSPSVPLCVLLQAYYWMSLIGNLGNLMKAKRMFQELHPVFMLIGFIVIGGEGPHFSEIHPIFLAILHQVHVKKWCHDLPMQWIYGFLTFFNPGGAAGLRRSSLP